MKKTVIIFLVMILLVLALAGCSNNAPGTSPGMTGPALTPNVSGTTFPSEPATGTGIYPGTPGTAMP